MLTEFKRVKHGEQPGDISRRAKIRLRESRGQEGTAFYLFPWQLLNERLAKSFIRYLTEKSKKRQRRRDKETIRQQYEDHLHVESDD